MEVKPAGASGSAWDCFLSTSARVRISTCMGWPATSPRALAISVAYRLAIMDFMYSAEVHRVRQSPSRDSGFRED